MLRERVDNPHEQVVSVIVNLPFVNINHTGFTGHAAHMFVNSYLGASHIVHFPHHSLFQRVSVDPPGLGESYSVEFTADQPPSTDLGGFRDSSYDRWNFFYRSISAVMRGSLSELRGVPAIPGQKPVIHRNIVGDVSSGSTLGATFDYQFELPWDFSVPLELLYNSSNSVFVPQAHSDISIERRLSQKLLNGLGSSYFSLTNSFRYYPATTYGKDFWKVESPFGYTHLSNLFRLYWSDVCVASHQGNYVLDVTHWLYEVTIQPQPMGHDVSVPISSVFAIDAKVFQTQSISNYVYAPNTDPPPTASTMLSFVEYNPTDYASMLSAAEDPRSDFDLPNDYSPVSKVVTLGHAPVTGTRTPIITGWNDGSYGDGSYGGSYNAFHNLAVYNYPDYVAGGFYSTMDALEKGSLSTNHLETLSELQSTLMLLNPKNWVRHIGRLVRPGRKYGVLGYLRNLADTNLTVQFGLLPSVSAAQELSSRLLPVLHNIQSMGILQTVYGEKLFHLEDDYEGFPDVRVECRSMVRLKLDLDSFWPFILPIDALGLLPTLSRIWEIIPMSFAFDASIFDVSTAATVLDHSFLRSAWNVLFSTHSTTISFDWPSQWLEDNDIIVGSTGKAPGYKLYVRYTIPRGLPIMGPTRLPVFRPPELLKFDIFGSLILTKGVKNPG